MSRDSRSIVGLFVVVLCPLAVLGVAIGDAKAGGPHAIAVQGLCLGAAVLIALAQVRAVGRGVPENRDLPLGWWAAVALAAAAVAIRLALHRYLPLVERAGFEEIQMGAGSWRLLAQGALPLEFRFSQILGAVGLAWRGNDIDSLRLGFRIAGCAGPIFLAVIARELGLKLAAAAPLMFAAGTFRWLVIGSGAAYEDFSGMPFLMALLALLTLSDGRRERDALWGGLAGIVTGILMFENSSYRFALPLALGWFAMRSWRSRDGRPIAAFLAATTATAAPMIADVLLRGKGSLFFEAVARYTAGRQTLVPAAWSSGLVESLRVFGGLPVRVTYYLARDGRAVVRPSVGVLLLLSFVWALVRPGRGFGRVMAATALGAVLACCLTTNFFDAMRLTPVVPLLLVTFAILLGDLEKALERILPLRWRELAVGALGVAAAAEIVVGGLERARILAADPDVRAEYRNNEYLIARHIAESAHRGERVLVLDADARRTWGPEADVYWIVASTQASIERIERLPAIEELSGPVRIVVGSEHDELTPGELQPLRDLASRTACEKSWRETRSLAGVPVAASAMIDAAPGEAASARRGTRADSGS